MHIALFHGALLYAVIVGGVAALVAFFGGKFLLPYNQAECTPCLTRTGADHLFLGCSRCSARLFPGPQHDDADLNFTDHRAGIQRRIQYWRRLVLHPAVRDKRYRTCQIRCRRRNPRNRSRCPGRPLLHVDCLWRKSENHSAESGKGHAPPRRILPRNFSGSFSDGNTGYLYDLYLQLQRLPGQLPVLHHLGWHGENQKALNAAYGEFSNLLCYLIQRPLAMAMHPHPR